MKLAKARILSKKRLCPVSTGHLVLCRLKMGGKIIKRQSIEHPGCVVIIPEIKRGQLLMIRQYRYAAREWIWEFPAGGVERGESFHGAAQRELMEETGYKAAKLKKIITFYPTPGISEEKMHVYHARGLKAAYAEKDDDEEFELKEFSLKQIGDLIRRGKIIDAKTLIGYFYVLNRLV